MYKKVSTKFIFLLENKLIRVLNIKCETKETTRYCEVNKLFSQNR